MSQSRGMLLLPVVVAAGGFTAGLVFSPRPSTDASPTDPAPAVVIEDKTTHLGSEVGISLADWLAKPRAELAKLFDEQRDTLRRQLADSRANPALNDLLPDLHLSVRVPVFQEASFSETAGFSLPPYLKPGHKDAAVALHLARHGDLEAAQKLADPADAALAAQLKQAAPAKNYPVEWTRLTALALFSAQLKLASNNTDGATEIVQLHRQLRDVLDPKAADGPLGSALLPLGRRALQQAAAAWRSPRLNKTGLAGDADAALAEWGAGPGQGRPLAWDVREVEQAFAAPATGHTVAVRGAAAGRALDLLAADAPLPAEGAEAVVGFLSRERRLGEVAVVYRPRIGQDFPEPRHLAQFLEERGYSGFDLNKSDGVQAQFFTGPGAGFDVHLFNRSTTLGGLVRVVPKDAKALTALPEDARDFGPLDLDRSFEANRLSVRPDAGGDRFEVEKKDELAAIARPKTEPGPTAAVVQKEDGHNLVASLTLRWPAETNSHALPQLLLPLWSLCGPARVEAAAGESPALAFVWQDATTRYTLRLPYGDEGPELIAADSRGKDALQSRADDALALDQAERKARLEAGRPIKRLPRKLHLDSVWLGLPRAEVRSALPRGRSVRQTPLADGVSLLYLSPPDPQETHSARQLFVRWGPGDKVAEIRVRYQAGPRAADKDHPSLLDTLRRGPAGAPEELPAPWARLWTDLPQQKPAPVFYRWVDDVTMMTYQQDAGGIELIIRDCDAEHPLGTPLPPLRFCSRGVDGCWLGDSHSDLLARWNITRPVTTADGALVLGQPEKSPYDAVLVWFEDGRAVRIVARHRLADGKALRTDQVVPAILEAWGRDIDRLGAVRRVSGARGQVVATYGWNDDVTRVVVHAQDTDEGLRLFTGWREWPIPARTVASKP